MFMPSRRPSLLIFPMCKGFKMPLEHVLRCLSVPLRSGPFSNAAWQPLALHTEPAWLKIPHTLNRSTCCDTEGKNKHKSVEEITCYQTDVKIKAKAVVLRVRRLKNNISHTTTVRSCICRTHTSIKQVG